MSTLSNNSYSSQAAIAIPVALAAIGFAYAPARPLIGLALVAALVLLFKPLAVTALRTALLILTPRQAVVVAKAGKPYVKSPVQTVFALNRKANQIAQTQPELAAKLRMQAYAPELAKPVVAVAAQPQVQVKSRFALNSKANRIAQTQPQLAAQLRMEAAYCLTH
ncbi:hypothetical protein ACIQW9_12175 [Herminiimonas sp. NPDC097707]|uniref:hypothetical protein n=1 Tax=Herminiimonas sp. NPDC097707 TaxID=3364007 RepID=UPI00383B09A7